MSAHVCTQKYTDKYHLKRYQLCCWKLETKPEILQYAEVRLLSLQKSKIIEEVTVQTREISEKVQALISRNEELNDRLERQTSYIDKLQRELSTFKSVNKNIKIVSLVLLFLLIGQIIAHFTL